MSDVLIEARGVAKAYPLVSRRDARLRALLRLLFTRRAPESTQVLQPVDLTVRRGESVAIIGENGAGKSTLLKLVTGVLTPSAGSVQVHGTVGALLELGAGFHPEYSGRENLRMAATLAGLGPAELRRKLPQIIDFADIGRYIDEPIKHYSSGMVVRLGFAVVAALRPDLLITDEVLAVGDEAFQKKCTAWIEDYLSRGGTLLLVSHSMYHVQKLCHQAIWLQHGEVVRAGDVFAVSQAYLAHQARKLGEAPDREARAQTDFTVDDWRLDGDPRPLQYLLAENHRSLRIDAVVHGRDGAVPHLHVGLVRPDGTPVYGLGSDMAADYRPRALGADRWGFALQLDLARLLPGSYQLRLFALDTEALRLFDTVEIELVLEGASRELGVYRIPHQWLHGDD